MRVPLLLVLLLAGCAGPADTAGVPDPPTEDPADQEDRTREAQVLLDIRLEVQVRGSGEVDFEMPVHGTVSLEVSGRWAGSLYLALVSPTGTEEVLADGAGAVDGSTILLAAGVFDNEGRLSGPAGTWQVEYQLDGGVADLRLQARGRPGPA